MSKQIRLAYDGLNRTPMGEEYVTASGGASSIDSGGGGPQPPDMEKRLTFLETNMSEVKSRLGQMELKLGDMHADMKASLGRLEPILTRIDATIPSLGTKAEVSHLRADLTRDISDLKVALTERPSKTYMWMIVAVLTATILAATAAGAALVASLAK